ncbi:MAG: hypothetical protein DME05_16380, partial [Candidatus Rokuibacteriota bacterium]
RLTPAHELLSSRFRVVAFEMPGFGDSPENKRTQTMPELASTMGWAISKLGIDTFNLMGTSFGGKTALWLALQSPQNVHALVLEAPAAIRQPGAASPAGTPEEIARLLYAHPERLGSIPPPDHGEPWHRRRWGSREPSRGAGHADAGAVRHAGHGQRVDGPRLQGADTEQSPRLRLRHRPGHRRPASGGLQRGGRRLPRAPRGVRHQPRRDGDPPVTRDG